MILLRILFCFVNLFTFSILAEKIYFTIGFRPICKPCQFSANMLIYYRAKFYLGYAKNFGAELRRY